jgi:hypothetical protein
VPYAGGVDIEFRAKNGDANTYQFLAKNVLDSAVNKIVVGEPVAGGQIVAPTFGSGWNMDVNTPAAATGGSGIGLNLSIQFKLVFVNV